MEDLCSGCLSTGRKLNFIGDMDYYYIFAQIMNEIPQVYDIPPSCIRLCWECRGHLNSFHRFKQRAVNCLTDLVQHAPLVCCSSISLYVQHILEYPEGQTAFDASPEVHVKCEWEHCEPEAFADCVDVTVKPEDDDEQPLKKKKKEPKLKTSKDKVKVKKKRKKKQAIDNDIDHDDPIDNEPIHDEPIDNDPIDMDPMGNGDSKDIDIEDTFSKNIDENVRNEIEIKKESNDLVKKGIKKIIVKKMAPIGKGKKKKRNEEPSRRFAYSEEALTSALSDIRGNIRGVREACRQYGIPRSTIQDRLSGRVGDQRRKTGPDPIFGFDGEKKIVDWIIDLAKAGIPISKYDLLDTVAKLAKELGIDHRFPRGKPGIRWYLSFLKRHPNISIQELKRKEPPPIKKRMMKKKVEETQSRIKCGSCDLDLISDTEEEGGKNIGCDQCMRWYHLKCTKLNNLSYNEAAAAPYECMLCETAENARLSSFENFQY